MAMAGTIHNFDLRGILAPAKPLDEGTSLPATLNGPRADAEGTNRSPSAAKNGGS